MDWKFPSGFSRTFIPRYIDWRYDAIFKEDDHTHHTHPSSSSSSIPHVHDIGSKQWYQAQNRSVEFYEKTDFNVFFSDEKEVLQSHSFDFIYALLRNKHYRKKAREMGLFSVRCKVCCIWNYLFRESVSFQHNSAVVARKKLGLSPTSDLIFVDLSFPLERLPQPTLTRHMERVFACVEKVSQALRNPVCVVASNNYHVLGRAQAVYPRARTNSGLFFTRVRYQSELNQLLNLTSSSSSSSSLTRIPRGVMIPRTEHNALLHFFTGFYGLQLNSTVIVTGKRPSPYSETMAALRHFRRPTGTYVVTNPELACRLDHYT